MTNRDHNDVPCFGWHKERNFFCKNIAHKDKKTIFIVGDSTTEAISSELRKKLDKNKFNYFFMNNSACYFIPEMYASFNNQPLIVKNETCDEEYQNKRLSTILNHPDSIIIIGGQLHYYLDSKNITLKKKDGSTIKKNYLNNINFLLSKGYKIIQMTPGIESDVNVSKKIKSNIILKKFGLKDNLVIKNSLFNILDKQKEAFSIFDNINNKNFHLMKTYESFCDSKFCYYNDNTNLHFFDYVHPSTSGSRMIVNNLFNLLKKL